MNSTSAPTTAIYVRISEDRQDGAGVARQLDDCRALVERQGWQPARESPNNNISASKYAKKSRPQYAAMIDAIKSGEVSRIVVYHLDRLYRQPRELPARHDLVD